MSPALKNIISMLQNLQKMDLKSLKEIAYSEIGSCCMSFCYKPAVIEYIQRLENEIERLNNERAER